MKKIVKINKNPGGTGHKQQVEFMMITCSGWCDGKSKKYCFLSCTSVQWVLTATLEVSSLYVTSLHFRFFFYNQKLLIARNINWLCIIPRKQLHLPHKPHWTRETQTLDSTHCHRRFCRANCSLTLSQSLSNGDSVFFGLCWNVQLVALSNGYILQSDITCHFLSWSSSHLNLNSAISIIWVWYVSWQ